MNETTKAQLSSIIFHGKEAKYNQYTGEAYTQYQIDNAISELVNAGMIKQYGDQVVATKLGRKSLG